MQIKKTKENKIITPNFEEKLTWKQVNTGQALWTRKKSHINETEYKEFYKNFFHDDQDPIAWSHNHVEGNQEYISLLYIPKKASWDIWNRIIDSSDLPLNISREILQNNQITKIIKNSLTKRILSIFSSTYTQSNIQNISLDDYVSRMQPNQEKIFYITADSYLSAKNNPHLEKLKEKNIEVLLLFDRIDEWMMNYVTSFNKIEFQSISKNNGYLEKIFDNKTIDQKKSEQELSPMILRIKSYLKDKVKNVRFTSKLTNTPAAVTTDEHDITTQ
uniref:Uncharacterized protein n=1 Tax=Glossina pallidipes TaxID=7398 RepID=A0A1A9Z186_GLOPL